VFLFLSVIPITFETKRGWSEGVAGLPYISLAIGTTLGYMAHHWQRRQYQKLENDPERTPLPESRLYGAMWGAISLPVGLFIYSFTQYGYLSWVGPTIALAPIAFVSPNLSMARTRKKKRCTNFLVRRASTSSSSAHTATPPTATARTHRLRSLDKG
jgi:hypothetical protein